MTGAKVWTASVAAGYRTDSTANPAVGDADGDGELEVYVSQRASKRILLSFDAQRPPSVDVRFEYAGPERQRLGGLGEHRRRGTG